MSLAPADNPQVAHLENLDGEVPGDRVDCQSFLCWYEVVDIGCDPIYKAEVVYETIERIIVNSHATLLAQEQETSRVVEATSEGHIRPRERPVYE